MLTMLPSDCIEDHYFVQVEDNKGKFRERSGYGY